MTIIFTLFMSFVASLYYSQYGGQWLFLIWICGIYCCVGGGATILPTYVDECFGHKHFGMNYGVAFTSMSI